MPLGTRFRGLDFSTLTYRYSAASKIALLSNNEIQIYLGLSADVYKPINLAYHHAADLPYMSFAALVIADIRKIKMVELVVKGSQGSQNILFALVTVATGFDLAAVLRFMKDRKGYEIVEAFLVTAGVEPRASGQTSDKKDKGLFGNGLLVQARTAREVKSASMENRRRSLP